MLVRCGCLSARTFHQRLLAAMSVQQEYMHELLLRNQNDTTILTCSSRMKFWLSCLRALTLYILRGHKQDKQ
jgi:hypothetical protein